MQRSGATVADILDRLVGFDTTSHKTNIPLILYVEDYLRGQGVASYLVPTEDGQKASLFATIGPEDVAGVALSGHTDVVPVEGQAWDSDPFALTLRDGRYYGRGTTDMKGFLACVLAAVPRFKAAKLRKPVHIAFSYDEEVGCIGVRPMIAEMGTKLPLPRVVIVGEPTDMRVVDAHKGPVRWQVDIAGRAAHSSMAHLGVNAITMAGLIIGELARIEAELAARTPDHRFEPPYPTLQVTTIEGGTASNIVPVSCRFGFEIRSMPGLDIGAIETRIKQFIDAVCLPGMQARAPEAGITVTRKNYVPPFGTPEGSEAVALALALAGQNETFAVSYATEAGLFQDAGAASVVCGPGNIAQAHTANEWIAVSELEKCSQFMDKLADWCAA
ncbi:MAG: acetylornithine deacetylase [Hyphomicrobium sp. 32-62-53]|nr:MAG: acetylornithine deacetylase [Hyphomicrobium sp. 12-62-95]OYY00946.1 MAG: acetylornithine deacetylase [Hyphomicrobium sp. 32-62-53]